jgi:bacteriorhodopsin
MSEPSLNNRPGSKLEGSSGVFKKEMSTFATVISTIKATPGYLLLFLWSILFVSLWICCKSWIGEDERFCYSNDAIVPVKKETLMYGFASCIFAVSAFMNMFATVMQSAKKKKQCASLVFFVEIVSCVTYTSLFFKAFPDLRNVDGKPFDWLHLFQWGFTTPAMLIILSGLGSSMEEQYINNWPLTRKAVIIVECVLMCGIGSLIYTGPLRFVFLFCAISGYIFLCRTIGEIMHFAIENAGTALEVQTLVVLKWTTYGLWSVFGMLQSLVGAAQYLHTLNI